jgi:hypothetical protein
MHSVSKLKKAWKQNLKAWWLRDILSKDFVGSPAYSNAAARVSPTESKGESVPNLTMCAPPSLAEFFNLFTQVFIDEYQLQTQIPVSQRRVTERTKATMHLIYLHYPEGETVELDHLIPWKKKYLSGTPTLKSPLPLNHIANYMPISSAKNNDRKNTSWSQYIDNIKSPRERRYIEENLLLPPNEFTDEVRNSSELFRKFLVRRWALIVDRALSEVLENEMWVGRPAEERCTQLTNKLIRPILDLLEVEDSSGYQIQPDLLLE